MLTSVTFRGCCSRGARPVKRNTIMLFIQSVRIILQHRLQNVHYTLHVDGMHALASKSMAVHLSLLQLITTMIKYISLILQMGVNQSWHVLQWWSTEIWYHWFICSSVVFLHWLIPVYDVYHPDINLQNCCLRVIWKHFHLRLIRGYKRWNSLLSLHQSEHVWTTANSKDNKDHRTTAEI